MATLLGQWAFAEGSGATVADGSGNANNLTVAFTDGGDWDAIGAGDGVKSLVEATGTIAYNNAVAALLESKTTIAINLVIDITAAAAAGRALFHAGVASNLGKLSVFTIGSGRINVYWDHDGGVAGDVRFDIGSWPSGVVVLGLQFDSTQAIADDRIRCFVNGTEIAIYITNTAIVLGSALPADMSADTFSIANRGDAARSINGAVYYAEMFDGTLTDQEFSDAADALTIDNNATWQAPAFPNWISYGYGLWTPGATPTDQEVLAGTGALEHATAEFPDETQIDSLFAGLTEPQYQYEWVAVEYDGTMHRATPTLITLDIELSNPQNTPEPDGATLTIESNSDLGTLYSYSKTTPFTGTEADAAEIMANGVGQVPVVGTNTRVVTGQDTLTDHYAGWVQDSEGYGSDLAMEFNMGAGETLTIPGGAGTYLFDIDWGDGTVETGLTTEGAGPHTYTDAIEAVVRVSGTFPHVSLLGAGDVTKLTKILNVGDVGWVAMSNSFNGALFLTELNIGVTGTATVEDFGFAFRNAVRLTTIAGLASLVSSNATSLSSTLRGWTAAKPMDVAIDVWPIGNVTNFLNFLEGSQLTTACYDRTLASWGNQTLAAGALSTTIHFGSSTYTDADSKLLLLDQCAGIIDGGYGGAGDYFINAVSGSDSNGGDTPNTPWASLNKITSSLLVPGETVTIIVEAGTYNTVNDYIDAYSGPADTAGAVIDLVFLPGCVMDGTAQTTNNGIECSGDVPWTMNIQGNGLVVQNYDDASANTPNGVGNRGAHILNVFDVNVSGCADGFSAHDTATMRLYDCFADECSKGPFIHANTATVEANRCVFTEKVGGGGTGLDVTSAAATPSIKCYDCAFIPDSSSTTFLYSGELHRCQIGTLAIPVRGDQTTNGSATAYDSYIHLYLDGNRTWTLLRCYGALTVRARVGGSIDVQHSVITGASAGQSSIFYSNYDPGAASKFIMSNNIFETADTFMSVDAANSGYLVASGSEFHNNMLPDGQTYDPDLVAADTGGAVIQGEVFGDPLIGPADDFIMYSYGFTSGSPASGAGTTGDIGFSIDDAWGG